MRSLRDFTSISMSFHPCFRVGDDDTSKSSQYSLYRMCFVALPRSNVSPFRRNSMSSTDERLTKQDPQRCLRQTSVCFGACYVVRNVHPHRRAVAGPVDIDR